MSDLILDVGQKKAKQALDRFLPSTKQHSWITRSLNRIKKDTTHQGVYLYGDVGRGKTMLMDMFYDALPAHTRKRRVHFHVFMKDVHEFLHKERQADRATQALLKFSQKLAHTTHYLCFDEFHVNDVADAMILSRLFTHIFEEGLIIIMTSNWAPDKLYEGGLQRDRLLPFIALIQERMDLVVLDGEIDYRTQALKGRPVYFSPLNKATQDSLHNIIDALTHGKEKTTQALTIKGRALEIKECYGDLAVFTFHDLCEKPLGTPDYLALATRFNIIILKDIPKLTTERRNEAKRFITLVDVLYDARIILIISAQEEPATLYEGHDHAFEFERTRSRLTEMQGEKYLS